MHPAWTRQAHVVTLLLIVSLVGCSPADAPTANPTAPASGSATATPGEAVITIASPIDDAKVTVPVTADGSASTVDGALTLELLTTDGDTLCARHIVATSGAGTASTWQTDLAFVPPDADESAILRAYELMSKTAPRSTSSKLQWWSRRNSRGGADAGAHRGERHRGH